MEADQIIAFLRAHKEEFMRRFTVERIGLFGSFLHGKQTDSSDIDILVVLERPTFDHYMDLKFQLEDSFGKSVDLIMESSIKSRIRTQVLRDVVYA
ncbi:MAG: nucleotidyltransferase family protein [Bacteroidetes bacterium]|nr:nucleotidyltransferase family protein [Bacteroidota bacterium]